MQACVGLEKYVLKNVINSATFSHTFGNVTAQARFVFYPEIGHGGHVSTLTRL